MKKLPNLCINSFIVFTFAALFSSCYAQDFKVREILSPVAAIVTQATRIETASLKVVSAQEAKNHALKSTARIAGYPIKSRLLELTTSDADKLVKIILDNKNYSNVRQRCRNQDILGIRFTKDKKIAEFALGMPCQQAIWAFSTNSEIHYWGAVLGTEPTQRVVAIIQK